MPNQPERQGGEEGRRGEEEGEVLLPSNYHRGALMTPESPVRTKKIKEWESKKARETENDRYQFRTEKI